MDRSATGGTSALKCLKEPLAGLTNRQDETRGVLFEGKFQSLAILDEEALVATYAYINLNPVAAGILDVPEANPHTSITERVEHVKPQGRMGDWDLPTAAKSGRCRLERTLEPPGEFGVV
jgi:hypothetical protein